jgi:exonuclease SbcD
MRILHTADWHIGQTLNGFSREAEHGAFLGKLPELAARHEADALIVAGDIFDGVNPSAESMKLLYDALAALHASRPALQIIIVAGNHDPAGRLEAPRALFGAIGVHVVGILHREAASGALDMSRHLVPLRSAEGDVRAHVLAIPYLRSGDLPLLAEDSAEAGSSPIVKATRRIYAAAVDAARPLAGGLPLLATGHLHCAGGLESEGAERRILIGGEHAAPADIFPDELAYVALGHLHRAQAIGRPTIRYSGSPFPMSATEIGYDHGVTLIELHPSGARCEHIKIGRSVPCIRVPESGSLTLSALPGAIAALNLDASCDKQKQPFVYAVIRPDGPAGGLSSEVQRVLEDHPLRCAGVKIDRPERAEGAPLAEPLRSLAECDPADLFEKAYLAAHGEAPDAAHRLAFESIRTGE